MTEYENLSDKQAETSLSLLELAKQNENNAWQMLVNLYGPVIYARCRYKWALEATEAENVGQEVFISVAKKLIEFDRQRTGSFRRWLRTITDNKCKDFFKKKQIADATGGSEAQGCLENFAEDIDDDIGQDVQNERAVLVRQAMKIVEDQFSERDCKIFWLIAVDDQDRGDVAEQFGITKNLVYVSYSRIRKRLCDVYQDLISEEI